MKPTVECLRAEIGTQSGFGQNVRGGNEQADLVAGVTRAMERTRDWLLQRQHADGFWCGELEGDTILESEFILLLAWLGQEDSPTAQAAARYLRDKQLLSGGWPLYPGGALDISVSVKAYFALKLTGHDANEDFMQRARAAIREHGGADAVNSFTRFYLALLGQIAYEHCPAVPPEMVLLPSWSPVNIYRISAWSRTIFVPLSIMWAYRPVRRLLAEQGIEELFLRPPGEWPELRCPGLSASGRWISWDKVFRLIDNGLKWCERYRLRPLRERALRRAESWMIERFEDSDGLGAIFPPIIWSIVALKCRGHTDDSPQLRYCRDQLNELIIEENNTIRLQPCKSPVWDTALTLRALAASDQAADATACGQAIDWLLEKEVRCRGDWAANVAAEPGGWFFEHRNAFYPDIDDTIMVLMALRESSPSRPLEGVPNASTSADDACQRALRWVLAMQNRDGGWGAFDKDNDQQFLCHVPFADHNAMIDPSTPDITARVLEALAPFGYSANDSRIRRAIRYVRETQEPDGSWFGRWGVNHIYGTWQALVGLTAIGVAPHDPAIWRGVGWLEEHQQPGGGWGESAGSYHDPRMRGRGPATASQTAWALLALIAAGRANTPAVTRGLRYLMQTQQEDGSWVESEFTGTGFPRVFYLRYHLYRIYFPLLALTHWRGAVVGRHAGVGESEISEEFDGAS